MLVCCCALRWRTKKYASFLMMSCKQVSETARALHSGIFDQPGAKDYFSSSAEVQYSSFYP